MSSVRDFDDAGLDILDGDAPALVRSGGAATTARVTALSVVLGVVLGAGALAHVAALVWYLNP